MYKKDDILTINRAEFYAIEDELATTDLYPEIIDETENEYTILIREIPKPQPWQIASVEIRKKKATLEKYKQDVEQVELFGMSRDDYEIKKQLCAEIIIELRELEKIVRENHPKYKK